MAPLRDGAVVEPEKLKDLPAAEQEQFRADVARLEERVREATDAIPLETRRLQQVVRELDREVAAQTIGHLLEELRGAFLDLPAVLAYLDALKADVLDNLEELLSPGEEVRTLDTLLAGRGARRAFARYEVNLLVDNVTAHGAPVVYENHPTLPNLVGRVDAPSELGHPASDHRLVVAGALHRANGGYLIVDAHKLLPQPSAWEGLKRALRSREIRIESVGQALSLMGTASVEPEPIPLRVKVVLLGERSLYLALSDADPEFLELFKVAADLDDSVPRTGATEEGFAAHLGSLARREGLRPLDASAAARMIDHAARVTGDAERLSLDTDALLDLLGEADHLAGLSGRTTLDARHVQAAIEAQVRRADRLRDRMQEEIRRGTILIETRGTQVGQVNALAVYHVGRYGFGRPSRITARVRLGNGRVLDIEREVALGGAIHSKGVLILAGFLGGRYAADQPLSLSASLVFEQSYGGVDGDSASCAELIALLSAIGEVPVTQSVAVTGSINQKGQVQPVGGVNEKIEGFFDVCCARGQACEEGVMIPAANIKHLMLRQDVVEAVREGRFRIWAVETIDEAIEVMTGMAAGERADGSFPPESFNGRVESRLAAFAERARDFARAALEPGP
jgi:lon-related putative ATP-dependent protease